MFSLIVIMTWLLYFSRRKGIFFFFQITQTTILEWNSARAYYRVCTLLSVCDGRWKRKGKEKKKKITGKSGKSKKNVSAGRLNIEKKKVYILQRKQILASACKPPFK